VADLSGPVGDTQPLLDGDNLDERLTFAELQATSVIRCLRWHGPDTDPWSGADWSNAMGGECGEAQNVVKKLRRVETRTGAQLQPPPEQLQAMLGEELADVICYAVLVARAVIQGVLAAAELPDVLAMLDLEES